MHMTGYAKSVATAVPNDFQVARLTTKDVEEVAELLKTTLSGISRRNYLNNMLDPKLNKTGIGYMARNTADQKVVGFTTSANTSAGIWCYSSVAVLQALYSYASNDLESYNDAKLYLPSVRLPMAYYTELRWLLSVGARLQYQYNLMALGEFNIRDGYTYCPSIYG